MFEVQGYHHFYQKKYVNTGDWKILQKNFKNGNFPEIPLNFSLKSFFFFPFNITHDWRAIDITVHLAPRYLGHSFQSSAWSFFSCNTLSVTHSDMASYSLSPKTKKISNIKKLCNSFCLQKRNLENLALRSSKHYPFSGCKDLIIGTHKPYFLVLLTKIGVTWSGKVQ